MSVTHDPAHRARITYTWRDERHYLIEDPRPHIELRSETTSVRTMPYPSVEEAEAAFWERVVEPIIASRMHNDPYAVWPGVELAAVRDPNDGGFHLVERSRGTAMAWRVATPEEALLAFLGRLRLLISESEPSHA
jgi:hypothetical protein